MKLKLSLLPPLVAIAITAAGCKEKKEEVPEHIAQSREMEEKVRKVREEIKEEGEVERAAGAKQPGPPDAEDIRFWTPEVQRGYYVLFRARGMSVPPAAQALARLGASAAPAFKRIASNDRMPNRKRMLASFMLVDIHMFRPADLAELARAFDLPFAQRGAIEALVRIGSPRSRELLRQLKEELTKTEAAAGAGAASHPLGDFIEQARAKVRPWGYDDTQLLVLDQIMQADTPDKLEAALAALGDGDLSQGLIALTGSPAAAPEAKAAVAKQLVLKAQPDLKLLRGYVQPQYPPTLRVAAAQQLLRRGNRRDRALLDKLARSPQDSAAQALRRLLDQPPGEDQQAVPGR